LTKPPKDVTQNGRDADHRREKVTQCQRKEKGRSLLTKGEEKGGGVGKVGQPGEGGTNRVFFLKRGGGRKVFSGTSE